MARKAYKAMWLASQAEKERFRNTVYEYGDELRRVRSILASEGEKEIHGLQSRGVRALQAPIRYPSLMYECVVQALLRSARSGTISDEIQSGFTRVSWSGVPILKSDEETRLDR